MSIDIDSFLAELDRIPWFAYLGKPSPLDGDTLRLTSWDAWPGPETPGGALIAEASQIRRERLLAAGDRPAIEAAWQRIHQRVFAQGQRVVPWKDDEDAWCGPNAALTFAAWDAALLGIARAVGVDLDEGSVGGNWTLAAEWRWLAAGHWPCLHFWQWGYCSLAQAARHGQPRQLIVY
jgi:hypothetical protein